MERQTLPPEVWRSTLLLADDDLLFLAFEERDNRSTDAQRIRAGAGRHVERGLWRQQQREVDLRFNGVREFQIVHRGLDWHAVGG